MSRHRFAGYLVSFVAVVSFNAGAHAQSGGGGDPFKQPAPTKESKPSKPAPKSPQNPPSKGTPERDRETNDRPTGNRLVDLRPKFRKGQEIRLKMELDSQSNTVIPALDDAPQESKSKQELSLVMKVKEVADDGSAIVELTIPHVKMSQTTPDDQLEFDSSKPEKDDASNPLAPSLRELSKTTMTVHFDRDGAVTQVTGGGNLASPGVLGGGVGGPSGGVPGLPGGGGLGGGLPLPSIPDAIGSIMAIKKGSLQVAVGEKWSTIDEIDSGLLGKFRMISDSALRSHQGGRAVIRTSGRIEPATASATGLSLVQVKDTSYVGETIWDTEAGMIRSMDMHQHVKIDAAISGGASMTSNTKTKVTRVR